MAQMLSRFDQNNTFISQCHATFAQNLGICFLSQKRKGLIAKTRVNHTRFNTILVLFLV
jgi:hypothetical protein